MPKPANGHRRYIAGLDGLRAFAVFAVIAYHLNLRFAPGGLIGVGVFFVLSGYLITDILLGQWKTDGHPLLADFWIRRARRLLPALLTMLLVVVLWVCLFDRVQVVALRGDVIAALLYISNWWFIFHKVSYFSSFGRPSPLGHLWSLAVEEQFYLVWPLVLSFGLRFIRRRGWWVSIILAMSLVSSLAMALIYQPGSDPSRVYYGTDTRAFALLIGAALAFTWPSERLQTGTPRYRVLVLDFFGALGILFIVLMIWRTNEYGTFLYRGGLVLAALATAVTIAAIVHPASQLGKLLGWKPLRWLGVRSYGIYLWHYPVIVLTSPIVSTGTNVVRDGLQVIASICLAALSWRYIESPIRTHRFTPLAKADKLPRTGRLALSRRPWFVPLTGILVVSICIGTVELAPGSTSSAATTVNTIQPSKAVVPVPKRKGQTPTGTHRSADSAGKQKPGTPGRAATKDETGVKTSQPTHHTSNSHSATENKTPPQGGEQKPSGQTQPGGQPGTTKTTQSRSGVGITAIGDSIMIDATPYLKQLFPGIVVDAKIGRQMIHAQTVVNTLKSEGELGNRVIIELGTNGPFTEQQLISLLNSLGPVKQVVLVNTRVPRPWETDVNQVLAKVASTYPNTTLVNWYAASAGKNSYFYPDGVHLNPVGASYFASLIAHALNAPSS
ncbi:acyltransferase family protein [Alicyclobacillus sp. ALC3]|uniref:acyltransferase family protein n=1 Tax=Alicyclobacillus sp. ALC3 TaxID=2796143 RepID=UPI00237A00ED|nr:acyltransferase family protein [Alicyclobacillus sp. ALC3]WDL95493.1 acyltransferase family protein [Alicyclobacillus sp. ALC3]